MIIDEATDVAVHLLYENSVIKKISGFRLAQVVKRLMNNKIKERQKMG
jgi:hypothetical protein